MTTEPLTEVQKARAELTATLDAIEYKLNVPEQARRAVRRAGVRVRALREENPLVLVGAAVAAAAVIGGAVWLAVRAARR